MNLIKSFLNVYVSAHTPRDLKIQDFIQNCIIQCTIQCISCISMYYCISSDSLGSGITNSTSSSSVSLTLSHLVDFFRPKSENIDTRSAPHPLTKKGGYPHPTRK